MYGEVERICSRIGESEETIAKLRTDNKNLFSLAASSPEVRRLVNSITTLISKTLKIVKENEDVASGKYEAIREQLAQLEKGRKVAGYLSPERRTPQYVDKKR